MSDERIAEIRARVDAAILAEPLPWRVDHGDIVSGYGTEDERNVLSCCNIEEDALPLIANAPADLAYLLAENARLRERVAALEAAMQAYKAAYDAASVVWDQEDDPEGWRDRMDAAHLAVQDAIEAMFAALAERGEAGEAS